MKIDNTYKPIGTGSAIKSAVPQGTAATSRQESVSLSSLAGSLQGDQESPVDTARIQEIKQAIADGRFTINSEAIANRLIESARDLVFNNGISQA